MPARKRAAIDLGAAMSRRIDNPSTPDGRMRPLRVAELVAAELRRRILDREYEELPTQDALAQEFHVSYPSLREAFRILETEGLVTVRRGTQGGAVVHQPSSQSLAYMLGLLLEHENVGLNDLGAALRLLEPACARLCAESPGHEEIGALLHEANNEAIDVLQDGARFTQASRRFHDRLVSETRNRTVTLVVSVLERLWSMHEEAWATRVASEGSYPTRRLREQVVGIHARIADAVSQGKAELSMHLARSHLAETQRFVLTQRREPRVSSTRMRFGEMRR